MICINDLKKDFGSGAHAVHAVCGIHLTVGKGEIFGLLGPNGAGKTTTMRMLCTLLSPSSGTIRIAGYNLAHQAHEIRKCIGYVSQKGGMEPDATGRENLVLQARLYGMDKFQALAKANELIESLNVGLFADRKTKTFSGGQRRIFDLAASIIHKPVLLFLDEPTTGLDPQSRARVWEEVKKLNQQGTTVFLTTHYLEEADELCSRVAIVDHGSVVCLGSPAELRTNIASDIIMLGLQNPEEASRAAEILKTEQSIKEIQLVDSVLHIYVDKTGNRDSMLPAVMRLLHTHTLTINMVQFSRPTLDDVFLKLTGRTLRDSEK